MGRDVYLQGLFIRNTKKVTCKVGRLLKITNKFETRLEQLQIFLLLAMMDWTSVKIKLSTRYSTNYM